MTGLEYLEHDLRLWLEDAEGEERVVLEYILENAIPKAEAKEKSDGLD